MVKWNHTKTDQNKEHMIVITIMVTTLYMLVAMIVTMTTLMPMVMIVILTMSVCGCDWDCASILYSI